MAVSVASADSRLSRELTRTEEATVGRWKRVTCCMSLKLAIWSSRMDALDICDQSVIRERQNAKAQRRTTSSVLCCPRQPACQRIHCSIGKHLSSTYESEHDNEIELQSQSGQVYRQTNEMWRLDVDMVVNVKVDAERLARPDQSSSASKPVTS